MIETSQLRQLRQRGLRLSALMSLVARGLSTAITLFTVPLTLNYLGQERFAVWTTLSSIAAILAFADLGIGNGLINLLAKSYAADDRQLARKYVTSAFMTLVGLALSIGLVIALIYSVVPWAAIYNVKQAAAVVEAGPATAIFLLCFLINLPLGVIQKIQMGYQETYIDIGWFILGKCFSVIALLIAISSKSTLSGLVFALVGVPLIATFCNGVHLFGYRRPWLTPSFKIFEFRFAKQLVQVGLLYFILQIASTIAYNIDNIIIAQLISAEAVTSYAVPAQLFRVISVALGAVFVGLWPAYGEALARNDTEWVRRTFRRTLSIIVLCSVSVSIILLIFGDRLIDIWVGRSFDVPVSLLLAFAVWTVVMNVANSFSLLLNAANIIKMQIICACLMAVCNVFLSIIFTRALGVVGVLWGSIISYVVFVLLPYAVVVPRLLRRFTDYKAQTLVAADSV